MFTMTLCVRTDRHMYRISMFTMTLCVRTDRHRYRISMFTYEPLWVYRLAQVLGSNVHIGPCVGKQTDIGAGFQCSHMTLCGQTD